MKQTLLSRLILAGLAGAAMTAAHAGQIQASSTSIAREVITTNTQNVTFPTTAYRFFGDVDPTVQTQIFQVQLTLATSGATADTVMSAALWDTAVVPTDDSFVINDGITGLPTANPYTILAKGFSSDKKTLWVTFSVTGGNPIIKQPIIAFNAAGATTRAEVENLKDVVGDLALEYAGGANGINQNCSKVVKMAVGIKHFVALSDNTSIATGTTNGTADEHIRASSTNEAVSIVFPTNVKVNVTSSTQRSILTPGGNLTFTDGGGAGTSWVSAGTVNLGNFALAQLGSGYDTNLLNVYALNTVAVNGLLGAATASLDTGEVETARIDVAVKATQGFVTGGSLFLSTSAVCASTIAGSSVSTTGAGAAGAVLTPSLTAAAINAAALTGTGTGTIHVCYTAPGTATIPSSSFTGIATVVKAAAGAGFNEQNNACGNPLYSLGGGLKIDVRNYASSNETSGYMSVLRFINNSDSSVADVWAQFVHQDGKLGNWAKIADLPVRGVVNMTAKQIDAALAAGSAATAVPGTAGPVAQAATATTSDTAPRLRITSTSGRSLRVQNYLFNAATGQILEGSGQQGVDFEGGILRAPQYEGQYQDQDANSGLNLAK
ncbi:hypothetical protein [Rhodoferax sp.]|uniref:hypothetical protein n=1 Tax=Rhodoferax sp. TaxID=50421 RepID=UPI002750E341|nr:hypothetical protein [Rhodoferax sp.]